MTGGSDVIDINIYNLLHMAKLDEFLVNSLTSAMQLNGEDALSDENTEMLETMATSAQEAAASMHSSMLPACIPLTVALKEALGDEHATISGEERPHRWV